MRDFDVRIGVQGVQTRARIGVSDEERMESRPIVVDVELRPTACDGLRNDDLAGTVDYARVVGIVERQVSADEYRLIERLAALIADALIEELALDEVAVTVRKPSPPTVTPVAAAWARVTRVR